jgi:predicted ABC-type ATPase
MTLSKKVVIIAGPNGAGKSTFAREFLPQESLCSAFINADMIAAGLSPFAPETAAIQAGRLMLRAIQEHAARGNSFALETTLSGLSYARSIPRWQAAGYVVKLVFLELPNAQAAINRVAVRVAQGGHHIPADTIRRRFEAGRRNFQLIYKPLVDVWIHLNNAGHAAQLIDWSEK